MGTLRALRDRPLPRLAELRGPQGRSDHGPDPRGGANMNPIPEISQWLMGNSAALGATAAALAIVTGTIVLLQKLQSASGLVVDRPRIYPVTNPRDHRIKAIEALQAYFPERERDPPGLLAQRIRESRYSRFGGARSDFPVVCLSYERRGKVLLFLTCHYHIRTGTIFFWYLLGCKAVERAHGLIEEDGIEFDRDDDECAIALIRQMLATCDRLGGRDSRWRQVIAEVDTEHLQKARGKMRLFQAYARRLSGSPQPRVFKLEAPFVMPVHDADMLDHRQEHETPGWFLFAPRDPKTYQQGDGNYYMRRDEVATLYGVLEQSYAIDNDPAYNAYLSGFFQKLAGEAPDAARLEHERREMR
jgi:hypothetical protein